MCVRAANVEALTALQPICYAMPTPHLTNNKAMQTQLRAIGEVDGIEDLTWDTTDHIVV